MNLKLLSGVLMFSAIAINAQLPTINENFDNFTSGSTTFPQNGWTTKLAPNPMPFPPAPLMIVTTDANKAVQAYSGNNTSEPSYLITPQIVAPAGDKSLSFTTSLVSPSPGPGSIQIGLASNPTDMSTFTPVGNPVTLSTVGTNVNVNVNIPASTSTYIVFKFTPTASHVAIQIDNVVYNTTSSLAVSDPIKSKDAIQFAVNPENTALQFVTKKDLKNIEVYSSAGQKVAEGKLNNQRFDISTLQTGIYYIVIETKDGSVTKSKFIKK
ncbi:choice-of-anchor J domain-containing protein [Chryseobacterium proteolyticum]|uniref:choice-of-anchor J domain-containing protein n=1 Tax=Chryseobacterium proteolyticum TaxID=118127 RepID=UPI0039836583